MSLLGQWDWLYKMSQMHEGSSPDGRMKRKLQAEKDAIIEALRTTGEYCFEFEGKIITIHAKAALSPQTDSQEPKA